MVEDKKPKADSKEVELKAEAKPVAEVKPKAPLKKEVAREKPKEVIVVEKPATQNTPAPKAEKIKPKAQKTAFYFKAFDKWDTKDIIITDPGLRRYVSLRPVLAPSTEGRLTNKQFWKTRKPIIERLINRVMVSGHRRKKHFRTSGPFSGKKNLAYKTVKEAFEIIERKTKNNPVEVFVKALENGAAREGITTIEYGGVAYPKAVDLSPVKRIDLVLRVFTQAAHHSAASSKARRSVASTLADEIIATYNNDTKSQAISRKIDMERQAQASR